MLITYCLLYFAASVDTVMPGKLKVRIVAARDLPVMDRASELTDAFAEVLATPH